MGSSVETHATSRMRALHEKPAAGRTGGAPRARALVPSCTLGLFSSAAAVILGLLWFRGVFSSLVDEAAPAPTAEEAASDQPPFTWYMTRGASRWLTSRGGRPYVWAEGRGGGWGLLRLAVKPKGPPEDYERLAVDFKIGFLRKPATEQPNVYVRRDTTMQDGFAIRLSVLPPRRLVIVAPPGPTWDSQDPESVVQRST